MSFVDYHAEHCNTILSLPKMSFVEGILYDQSSLDMLILIFLLSNTYVLYVKWFSILIIKILQIKRRQAETFFSARFTKIVKNFLNHFFGHGTDKSQERNYSLSSIAKVSKLGKNKQCNIFQSKLYSAKNVSLKYQKF